MADLVIRRFRPSEHAPGTKGHDRGRCTECREPPVVSVDWHGTKPWVASYCAEHLQKALDEQQQRLVGPWISTTGACSDQGHPHRDGCIIGRTVLLSRAPPSLAAPWPVNDAVPRCAQPDAIEPLAVDRPESVLKAHKGAASRSRARR
jgi:hypothetical protein